MNLRELQVNEAFLPATVFCFPAKIDYQQGAVVSKTIVKKDTGTVTLFAFSKGQGLSEHSAPYDAIVQVVEGRAVITINKVEYTLQQGESIIMPANVPHAVSAVDDFKMLLTMVRG